jgi:hypothetical protein
LWPDLAALDPGGILITHAFSRVQEGTPGS